MNAPKKLWIDKHWEANFSGSDDDTPYIRADLVAELVEALEGLQEWVNGTAYDKARAALKALEEE